MKISKEDAERLQELFEEVNERVTEFKKICRNAMMSNEYELFKHRCLAHLEPGLLEDSDWLGRFTTLESIAERAQDEAEDETVDTSG